MVVTDPLMVTTSREGIGRVICGLLLDGRRVGRQRDDAVEDGRISGGAEGLDYTVVRSVVARGKE